MIDLLRKFENKHNDEFNSGGGIGNEVFSILERKKERKKEIFGDKKYLLEQLSESKRNKLLEQIEILLQNNENIKIGFSGSFAEGNMGKKGTKNSRGKIRTEDSDIDIKVINDTKYPGTIDIDFINKFDIIYLPNEEEIIKMSNGKNKDFLLRIYNGGFWI
ncbi:MAG: hypothetical protein Q9M94_01285 [Candidatus Gracilibacteria bacterium]|nr:hypothetical protein [Candidatus Gracilibacteria bacterium]MDQ7023527.1 hypothetical protein [Candidatus Gracilibacteria bacterium]